MFTAKIELSIMSQFLTAYNKNSRFATLNVNQPMKIFNFIKEVLQYAGIIILSCLSALWLMITGKKKK